MLYQELKLFLKKIEVQDKQGFDQLHSYHEILAFSLAISCLPEEVDAFEWFAMLWKDEASCSSGFGSETLAVEFANLISVFQKNAQQYYQAEKMLPSLEFENDLQATDFACSFLFVLDEYEEEFQAVRDQEADQEVQIHFTLWMLLNMLANDRAENNIGDAPSREEIKVVLPSLISQLGHIGTTLE